MENVILVVGLELIKFGVVFLYDDIVVDNVGVFEFIDVFKKLGVIGGGIIGLELGSVWNCVGFEVVVFEVMDLFLFMVDC